LTLDSLAVDFGFGAGNPFPKLKKMGYFMLIGASSLSNQLHLPPKLTHLDMGQLALCSQLSFSNVISSPLRYLRISSSKLGTFPDLPSLPQLQHVEVMGHEGGGGIDLEAVAIVCSFQSLTSLSLRNYRSWETEALSYLFQHLPTSITRLDFPLEVPIQSLGKNLETGVLNSIKTVGLSNDPVKRRLGQQELESLKEECGKKGIDLEYIDERFSIFGEFSFSLQSCAVEPHPND
jgi:hypothetical protein